MLRYTPLVVIALVISAATPTLAQSASDAPTELDADLDALMGLDLDELLGVTVSVSGRKESLAEAPAAVTVLDREDIRRAGVRTVPDLLRRVPGVQVIRSGPGNYVVSIRGMGGLQGNNIVVLLDGVPLNNPSDAEVDWGALPVTLESIQRVEVVRGPVSPIYGANAYTGLIAIETLNAPSGQEMTAGVSVGAGIDSSGKTGQDVNAHTAGRKDAYTWVVAAHGTRDALLSTSEDIDQSSLTRAGIVAKGSRELTDLVSVGMELGGTVGKRTALDYIRTHPDEQQTRILHGRLALTLLQPTESLDELEWWHRGRWFEFEAPQDKALSFGGLSASDVQTGVDLTFNFEDRLHLVLGAEGGATEVEAPYIHPDENGLVRLNFGARAVGDLNLSDSFRVGAAGRVDTSDFGGPVYSYRASAVYHRPTFALRLAAGSAFRNPSYVEVASRFVDPPSGLILLEGDSGLDFPRVESIELGGTMILNREFTLKPTVYFARATKLMVGDFGRLVRRTFHNDTGEAHIFGQEIEAAWKLSDEVEWQANAANLIFLRDPDDPAATIGIEEHNSKITAYTGVHFDPSERLAFGGGLTFLSERNYNVRAGIPPRLYQYDAPHSLRLDASASWLPVESMPLWLHVKAESQVPHRRAESPLPNAATSGSAFFALLEYRINESLKTN